MYLERVRAVIFGYIEDAGSCRRPRTGTVLSGKRRSPGTRRRGHVRFEPDK